MLLKFSFYSFVLTIFSSSILAGSALGHQIPDISKGFEAMIGAGAVSETVVLFLCLYTVRLWTCQNRLYSVACLLICSSLCRIPVILVILALMTQNIIIMVVSGLAFTGHILNLVSGIVTFCRLRRKSLQPQNYAESFV